MKGTSMKRHRMLQRLVLQKETIAQLSGHLLSDDELRKAVGGSVLLSCEGLRCSNNSACAAGDTNPLCG